MFDTDNFLNTQTTETTATEYAPVPEGEFNAVIDKLAARSPKGNSILDVSWRLDAPGDTEADGKIVRQSVFLDITENGGLDNSKGKNVQLGRLRAAIGQNNAGQAWAPNMMLGQVAIVSVKHRVVDDGTIYADVKGTAPVA